MFGGKVSATSKKLQFIFDDLQIPSEYNAAFINLYPNGNYHIPPHRDTTHDMDKHNIISYSFYETGNDTKTEDNRIFVVEDNNGNIINKISMEHASKIIMFAGQQRYFKHSVPKHNTNCARINITFRVFN
jgi:alkylated DNA repair dioxygenase AlkB